MVKVKSRSILRLAHLSQAVSSREELVTVCAEQDSTFLLNLELCMIASCVCRRGIKLRTRPAPSRRRAMNNVLGNSHSLNLCWVLSSGCDFSAQENGREKELLDLSNLGVSFFQVARSTHRHWARHSGKQAGRSAVNTIRWQTRKF